MLRVLLMIPSVVIGVSGPFVVVDVPLPDVADCVEYLVWIPSRGGRGWLRSQYHYRGAVHVVREVSR